MSVGAVQALGRLTQLQHLLMDSVSFRSLQPLSSLTELRSCVLSGAQWDATPLLTLSQLTRLQLEQEDHTAQIFDDGVLRRLCAGLPSLCALRLPSFYALSDAGVESLCALTSLTHLQVAGGLNLCHRPPHRLLNLRKLRVIAPPSQLLCAMHLMSQDALLLGWIGDTSADQFDGVRWCPAFDDMNLLEDIEVTVDMRAGSEEEATVVLADMALLTQHILATRHVAEVSIDISQPYSARDVAATLGPLVPRIRSLGFYNFRFAPSEWREMEALLRSVRVIQVNGDALLTAEILAFFAGSARLQQLRLCYSDFKKKWVVAMAALRNTPLTLDVYPKLSPHVITLCKAAAERAHGAQFITFNWTGLLQFNEGTFGSQAQL